MSAHPDPATAAESVAESAAPPLARVRLPFAALIAPVVTLFCVLPLATAGGLWAVAFLLPLAVLVLVVAGGTTATSRDLSTRWWNGRRRIPWDQLDRLEFPGSRWAVAVTHSGRRMTLPGVRPKDLPRLVRAAGGRLFLQRPAVGPAVGGGPAVDGTAGRAVARTAGVDTAVTENIVTAQPRSVVIDETPGTDPA